MVTSPGTASVIATNLPLGIDRRAFEAAIAKLAETSTATQDRAWSGAADRCVAALREMQEEEIATADLPFFQQQYRDNLDQRLSHIAKSGITREDMFWILFYAFAALREWQFGRSQFSPKERELTDSIDAAMVLLMPQETARIEYLRTKLPRDLVLGECQQLIKAFREKIAEDVASVRSTGQKVDGWTAALEQWDSRVREIESSLKRDVEELNFVGLSKAFSQLIEKARKQKKLQIVWLVATGALLILVPTLTPAYLLLHGGWNVTAVIPIAVPALVIELMLLYFFRIFLKNFYSLDAQETQLQLRNSLCAFVQSYAEFVGKVRTAPDSKVLERFEALIFSGISSDAAALPSQFDGLEQVVRLVNEFKPK